MMMQAAGGILVIGSAFLMGWRASEELEKEYQELGELQRIISMLQGEIRYARAFLAEAFESISRTASEPYKGWMVKMYQKMNARECGSFVCIWEHVLLSFLPLQVHTVSFRLFSKQST